MLHWLRLGFNNHLVLVLSGIVMNFLRSDCFFSLSHSSDSPNRSIPKWKLKNNIPHCPATGLILEEWGGSFFFSSSRFYFIFSFVCNQESRCLQSSENIVGYYWAGVTCCSSNHVSDGNNVGTLSSNVLFSSLSCFLFCFSLPLPGFLLSFLPLHLPHGMT